MTVTDSPRRLPVPAFEALCNRLLQAAGAGDEDRAVITDALLWATLRGNDSHGIAHLPMYVRMYLRPEDPPRLNPAANPTVTSTADAVVVVDGDGGPGQRVLRLAADLSAERATRTGVAVATAVRSTHHGALGYALERLVRRDMIGLIFVCSGASTPPYGGSERKLGTNPVAIGIPAGECPPILVDMSTSASTWLGLLARWKSGDPIPEGVILDDDGRPTTDRAAFTFGFRSQDATPRGALSTIGGGHKGSALQLAVEMLGGILPGLLSGNDIGTEGQVTATVMALRVGAFQDVGAFKARVDERIRELKASRPAAGSDGIWMPGERGYETAKLRRDGGIPIGSDDWSRMAKVASEVGVDIEELVSTVGAPGRGG